MNGLDVCSDGVLIGPDTTGAGLSEIDPATAGLDFLASLPLDRGLAGGLVIRDSLGYYVTGGAGEQGSNELYSFDPFTGGSMLVGPLSDAGQTILGFSALATEPSVPTCATSSTGSATRWAWDSARVHVQPDRGALPDRPALIPTRLG